MIPLGWNPSYHIQAQVVIERDPVDRDRYLYIGWVIHEITRKQEEANIDT